MKKLVYLVVTILILTVAAGCSGGGSPSQAGQAPQSVQPDASAKSEANTAENDNSTADASPAAQGNVTVEEQVLMEQDGIRVTLKSLETGSFMGSELKVLVENDSDKAVTIQTRDTSINGIMVNPMFSCDVEPGKKANSSISFMSSELDNAGIEMIKDIELKLSVSDSSTYDNIFKTETIVIATSATDYVQKYDDSGSVALDRDGFKVVVKKLDNTNSFWGADIYVYVENNSDTDATVQIRDTSVNGFMIEPSFSCDVLAGKKAFSSITFFESQLTDNDIADITEIELKFHVANMNSFDTMFDSEIVKITF